MGRKFAMIEKKDYLSIVLGTLVFFGLYLTSLYSYLLFHSLAEIFSIVVACGIFMLAWNSRQFLDNACLLFIGIAYLFVGGLDLIHTLAYEGMGVFEGYGANLPTQLWIGARYVESISLLIAPLFLGRKLKVDLAFPGYSLAISLLLGSIFLWNVFPICFIEGVGLTLFKKISEYIISLILLGSIAMLLRKGREFDLSVMRLLVASIALTIGSELAFTFYVHVYGLSNLIGHYLKIISFYLIYKAIVETGLTKPYSLLFRNLKQSEEALRVEKQFTDDVIETLTDTFYIFDPENGKGLRWNKALEEMSGYNYNDMRYYPPTHFYPPEEHRRIEEAIKTIQENGRASVELTYTTKDGRHIPFEYSAVLIESPKGKPWICAIGRDITQRKEAEDQIIRAKKEWERTFDVVPDLIMIVDNEYRIVRINKAMADRLSSTPKDLVGQICYEAVHGTEDPPPFCPHHHLMTDGLAHSAEVHEDRLGGDFLISVDPLHDPDGKLAGSVHVARDITDRKRAEEILRKAHDQLEQRVEERTVELKEEIKERKQAEEALHETELSYRTVADFTYDWEYWANPDGTLRYVSPSCERISGYGVHQFMDNPSLLWEIILPEDSKLWDQHNHDSGQELKPREIQFRIRTRDGEIRWIEHVCQPVIGKQGEFLGFRASNRNITERKEAEKELRIKDSAIASSINAIGITDLDGKLIYVNDSCVKMWGYDSKDEMVGRSLPEFWEGKGIFKTIAVLREKGARIGEDIGKRKDGSSFNVHFSASMIRDEANNPLYMFGSFSDITEQKIAEKALREREAELGRSQKDLRFLAGRLLSAQEEERRRLAREMHDDLTQRLAVLAIEAGKLEQQLQSAPGPISGKLREMKEGMVKLSADVHAISRQLHPSILDDLGLVDAIKSECNTFAQREGIVVTYEPKGIPPKVPRDVGLCIYRIIQEGLRNIAKHARASKAQISLVGKDGSIHLSIKDTGIGFDPTRVKKKTGLGLASMEERVRLIRGDFSIQSKRGKGTVITVRAPLSGA